MDEHTDGLMGRHLDRGMEGQMDEGKDRCWTMWIKGLMDRDAYWVINRQMVGWRGR
jgi:hypothetical protein